MDRLENRTRPQIHTAQFIHTEYIFSGGASEDRDDVNVWQLAGLPPSMCRTNIALIIMMWDRNCPLTSTYQICVKFKTAHERRHEVIFPPPQSLPWWLHSIRDTSHVELVLKFRFCSHCIHTLILRRRRMMYLSGSPEVFVMNILQLIWALCRNSSQCSSASRWDHVKEEQGTTDDIL